MEHWYRNSWNKVVRDLDSDIYKGLTLQEVELRRKGYGSNRIKVESFNIYLVVIKLVLQLWFINALANGYILFTEGQKGGAVLISLLAVLGLALQITLSIRRYLVRLKINKRNKINVRVIREGTNCIIKAEEIVIGDIVVLQEGAIVPADLRIIECNRLLVVESSITGETTSVEKYSTMIDEEISNIANIRNMLFRSSIVTQGTALGITVAIGMGTVDSGIIQSMNKITYEEEALIYKSKRALNRHILFIIIISTLSAVFFKLYGYNLEGVGSAFKTLLLSGSLYNTVLCGILMSLLITVHINNGEVQLLKSSDILKVPQIDILFMEKFGSISERKITLTEIYTDKMSFAPNTDVNQWNSNLDRIYQTLLLCNSYNELSKETEESYNHIIDKSLKLYVEEKLKYEIQQGKFKRLFVNPYDNERRLMTYVYKVEEKYRAYCKGMLDSVINSCTYIMKNGLEIEITREDLEDIKSKAVQLESKGLHVLAVAYRNFAYEPTPVENVESNMVFVGLLVLKNSLRDNAQKSILEFRKNGIRPVLFTEDTKLSAFTWGKKLGLVKSINEILSGVEMDNMSVKEYENYFSKIGIYSKLTPDKKAQVIKTFSSKGVLTAYVCKGAEDLAPALNSDFSIVRNKSSKRLSAISSLLVERSLLSNLLDIIKKVKVYVQQVNKANEFIVAFLVSQTLLTIYLLSNSISEAFNYSNSIWMGLFNLPIMIAIILMDSSKEGKVQEKVKGDYAKTVQPRILRGYKAAAIIAVLTILLQFVLKKYIYLDVNLFLIFNLLLIASINFFRIKNKKLLSLANLIYISIIVFNLVLIFIMNR